MEVKIFTGTSAKITKEFVAHYREGIYIFYLPFGYNVFFISRQMLVNLKQFRKILWGEFVKGTAFVQYF